MIRSKASGFADRREPSFPLEWDKLSDINRHLPICIVLKQKTTFYLQNCIIILIFFFFDDTFLVILDQLLPIEDENNKYMGTNVLTMGMIVPNYVFNWYIAYLANRLIIWHLPPYLIIWYEIWL